MQLLVNGESYEVDVDGETTLLAVLRHDLFYRLDTDAALRSELR